MNDVKTPAPFNNAQTVEERHAEILLALVLARQHVVDLEAKLAGTASLLGIGIDHTAGNVLEDIDPLQTSFLETNPAKNDLSPYLGSEGNDATRPQLDEAPESIQAKSKHTLNSAIRHLALAHPDDALAFTQTDTPVADSAVTATPDASSPVAEPPTAPDTAGTAGTAIVPNAPVLTNAAKGTDTPAAVTDVSGVPDALEAVTAAKNEFLANISHELRTPLNGILGMLQLLRQSPLTPEQREYVDIANYSGRSLLRIISDILDFSRLESGTLTLDLQLFDFAATMRSTLGMFLHQAEEKKLTLTLKLHNSLPPLLLGDATRIRQIIFNLMSNAFKFTEKGSILVECSLLPRKPGGKHCLYLAVHDTGIGISKEKFDEIFQPFTQADNSLTRRYAGTGLGLGLVQKLTQLMGGNLCVESELGVGSSIHCALPFMATGVLGSSGRMRKEPQQKLDILVAEDDLVNQLTISCLLRKKGHTITCVNNGKQAIEALLLHSFDCLITDIQMPEMDGITLMRRIRHGNISDITPSAATYALLRKTESELLPISSELPIVALTAHAIDGDRENLLSLGMDYYLPKPINVAELTAVLQQISTGSRKQAKK